MQTVLNCVERREGERRRREEEGLNCRERKEGLIAVAFAGREERERERGLIGEEEEEEEEELNCGYSR